MSRATHRQRTPSDPKFTKKTLTKLQRIIERKKERVNRKQGHRE